MAAGMNRSTGLSAVTGAFGFTGKYITRRLLSMSMPVRTLTGHPNRPNDFGNEVDVAPLDFDNRVQLADSLRGAEVLYNTYWIRFSRGRVNFDLAVANTVALIRAAEEAGLRRIVHISITNPSVDSPLPYFRGKALAEEAVVKSRLSHAILRPALLYGIEDILLNNIAWFLRRSPVFPAFGSGSYRVRPIFVGDLAQIAVSAAQRDDDLAIDAVGPETITFEELVRLIAGSVERRARVLHLNPGLALLLSRLSGFMVRDVVLTRDEIEGLMGDLLVTQGPATGQTRLSDWLAQNGGTLGASYSSELNRHYR